MWNPYSIAVTRANKWKGVTEVIFVRSSISIVFRAEDIWFLSNGPEAIRTGTWYIYATVKLVTNSPDSSSKQQPRIAIQWNFVIPGKPHWTRSLTRILVLSVAKKYSQTSGCRSKPNRKRGKQSAGLGNLVRGWTSRLHEFTSWPVIQQSI